MIDNIFMNFIGGWGPDAGWPNPWFWPLAVILGEILFIWIAKKAKHNLETGSVLFLKIVIMVGTVGGLALVIALLGGILELLKSPQLLAWAVGIVGTVLFFYLNVKIFRYFNKKTKKKKR